jgi:hypothetical protein
MKKVVCIDARNYGNTNWDGPDPKEGDILTVSWEGMMYGIYSYQFVECGPDYAYSAWRFAPLNGADETALVTEEFEEKYCVPVNS